MTKTVDSSAIDKLTESIGQSALLFQQNPGIEGWEATRAAGPEVAAFVNDDVDTPDTRTSLVYHDAGEVDEDGYEWENETWVVESRTGVVDRPHPSFTDRDEAITCLAEVMVKTNEEYN